jgi:DNA-binding MarR family transcriptional regulator
VSIEIRVLQTLRLKGRALPEDVAAAAGIDTAELSPIIEKLTADGNAEEARGRLKLTKPGREVLEGLLAEERKGVDQDALKSAYHDFDQHNSTFKQLITDWQLKDGDTPNDHSDSAYDQQIVERLVELDAGFTPLLTQIVSIAPRLEPYPARFAGALEKVQAGDHTWIARPMIDSYHTVWFELHEDLIGLAGLNRADEAAAGRAE